MSHSLPSFALPLAAALVASTALTAQIGSLVLPAGIGDDPRSVQIIGNGHVAISNQVDGWQHFVDVTVPTSPTLTTSFNPPFGDQWFEAEYTPDYGGLLFTAHRFGGVNMIDVSNPSSPAILGSLATTYHFRGLRYQRNGASGVLYENETNQGLQVLDILSGTGLNSIWNNFGSGGDDGNGIELLNGHLYQLGQPPFSGQVLLKTFDVTIPSTPVLCGPVQTIPGQSSGHALIRKVPNSARMVAARWDNSLDLIDATSPCNPVRVQLVPANIPPVSITFWGATPFPGSVPWTMVYGSFILTSNPSVRYYFWWFWTIPAVGPVAPGPIFLVPLDTHDVALDASGRVYIVGRDPVLNQGLLWIY